MDEICVRVTPSLWLWVHASMNVLAVSRKVRQVLGFAFGRRDRATLALCWSDMPPDYQDKPVVSDELATYAGFFGSLGRAQQHRSCAKGSGETSIVESLNTKWRQRQSGLVRRACGTSRRIEADLVERFFLLVEQHNRHCRTRWEQRTTATRADQ